MALKIINENEQEVVDIEYPCLMESINTEYEVVVLALGVNYGIAIKNNFLPSSIGVIDYNWTPFDSKEDWKPYNKSVTFCNA